MNYLFLQDAEEEAPVAAVVAESSGDSIVLPYLLTFSLAAAVTTEVLVNNLGLTLVSHVSSCNIT
jgi:hypothetical protein